MDIKKQLKIKIDSLNRLEKDFKLYQKEEKQQIEIVDSFKNNPEKDIYDVKKQEEILDESKAMILDALTRLVESIFNFSKFLEENSDKNDDSEIWKNSIDTIEKYFETYVNDQ
ncbi:hypothetical protein DLAC_06405 [Tieghemostelium lacteum]|uniref:Tubulin-specific chaperone A n=1 Tax=Tieghemostelium lacteum TaxID=361077 RepID=A0A151ZES5_TIELA|nr:hypothetical protein DLAC_06405 [Tieghemostelium lacteum]|eukprot:KYQ92425.1 hypothetical protein DLAC_06405 [Tieghemostelium lacteum]